MSQTSSFFHDQVGRTLYRDAVIATFRDKFEGDYVERHQTVQRELIKQSLRLFAIPGYGVLEVGITDLQYRLAKASVPRPSPWVQMWTTRRR
jgi:hypothetical protein